MSYKRVTFSDLCRLCAQIKKTHEKIQIFHDQGKRLQLQMKIKTLFDLQVNETDGLPKAICMECCKRLEESYRFRQECLQTGSMLNTCFENHQDNKDFLRTGKIYIKDDDMRNVSFALNTDYNTSIIEEETKITPLENIETPPESNSLIKINTQEEKHKITINETSPYEIIPIPITENVPNLNKNNNNNTNKETSRVITKFLVGANGQQIQLENKDRRFVCNVCHREFKRREHLYQHSKIHLDSRPFRCHSCNRTFLRKDHLSRHQAAHVGSKNYVCNVCFKSFSRNDNLLKHKKTHTKDLQTKDLQAKDLNGKNLNAIDLNTKNLHAKDLNEKILRKNDLLHKKRT